MLEGALFFRNICGCEICFLRNKAIKLIKKHQRFRAAVTDVQLDHQLGETHGAKAYAAFSLLVDPILFKMVRRFVNDIIQEPCRITDHRRQLVPSHIMFFFVVKLGQVDCRQVADSPSRKPLLPARICTYDRIEIPAVGHLVVVFHEYDARFRGFPGGFDNRMPHVAGLHRTVMNNVLTRFSPLLQIPVPNLVIFRVRRVRVHQFPIQIFLHGFHEAVADAYGQIGIRNLPHRLFDGNKIQYVRVPIIHHQHQRAAAAATLLDQARCIAEQSAPGNGAA